MKLPLSVPQDKQRFTNRVISRIKSYLEIAIILCEWKNYKIDVIKRNHEKQKLF